MVRSRKLDDKEIQLKNQSQAFFQISGAGHEAMLVAAGLSLRPGYDWFHPVLPRSRAVPAARRDAARHAARRRSAPKDDPSNGGRQMPSHWGAPALNIVSGSSATATQVLHAVGAAEAGVIYEPRRARFPIATRDFHGDEIVYTSLGEGSTSEGEFWEALNAACTEAACRCCSSSKTTATRSRCRSKSQTPGGDISRLVRSFPGLHVESIDGTDFFASLRAMREAAAYVRARKGPALVHARVIRPVLALAVRRREAVQDAGGARGRGAARSDQAVRRVPARATTSPPPPICARSTAEIEREIDEAAQAALQAPKPREEHARRSTSTRPTSIRRRPRSTRRRSPRASPTRWSTPSTAR